MSHTNRSKLYIGGLSDRINRYDLEREFKRHGQVLEAWVARKPPGFGFIEFEDPRDAADAIREMDGATIQGMRIRVEYAKKMGREPTKTPRSPSYTSSYRNSRYSPSRRARPTDRTRKRRTPSPFDRSRHKNRSRSGSEEDKRHNRKNKDRSRSTSPMERRDKRDRSRSPNLERKDKSNNDKASRSPAYKRERDSSRERASQDRNSLEHGRDRTALDKDNENAHSPSHSASRSPSPPQTSHGAKSEMEIQEYWPRIDENQSDGTSPVDRKYTNSP